MKELSIAMLYKLPEDKLWIKIGYLEE